MKNNISKKENFKRYHNFLIPLIYLTGIFLLSCGESVDNPVPTENVLKVETVKIDGKGALGMKTENVSLKPELTVIFSENITDSVLQNSSKVTLMDSDATVIPLTFSQVSAKTIKITTTQALKSKTQYTLTIAKDLSVSLNGKVYKLSSNAILIFTTITQSNAAELTAITLALGGTDVVGVVSGEIVKFPTADKTITSATVKAITISPNASSKAVNDELTLDSGTFALVVTAEDGTTKTYTLKLVSNIAKLTALTLAAGGKSYVGIIDDPNNIVKFPVADKTLTSTTIELITPDADATATKVLNDSITFTTSTATATETIVVTAEDGTTTKTYTLKLVSNIAKLSALTLTIADKPYVGVFDEPNNTVKFSVPDKTVSTATASLVTVDSDGTSSINKDDEVTFTNSTTTLRITAEDGVTTKDYTLNLLSNLAKLTTITLTIGGTGGTDYSTTFADGVFSATIPVTDSSVGTATLKEVAFSDGASINPIKGAELTFTNKSTTITVTAEDTTTTKDYVISLVSVSTELSALTLTINGNDVVGTVQGTTINFSVADKTIITTATVKLITIPTTASASKNKDDQVTFANATSTITVTAEDGKTEDYTLKLLSNAKVITALSLTIGGTNIQGVIDEPNKTVNFSVADKTTVTTTTVQLITTSANATADKLKDDTITFANATSTITVTAEDGMTATYTLKLLSNVAKLSALTLTIGGTNIQGVIDEPTKTVKFSVADKTVSTATASLVTVDSYGTSSINQGQDVTFTNSTTTLRITTEDGITTKDYSLILLSNKKELTALTLLTIAGDTVTGTVEGTTVKFLVPRKDVESAVIKLITISPDATSNNNKDDVITINDEGKSTLIITAEDGSTTEYEVKLIGIRAKLIDLTLEIETRTIIGVIDEANKSVKFSVNLANVTTATIKTLLTADSATANKNIDDELTFTNGETTLTITSESGDIPQVYKLEVKNNAKEITKLTLQIGGNDFVGEISGTTIRVFVTDNTVAKATITLLEKSALATSSVSESDELTFNKGLGFITVTAADGSQTTYAVLLVGSSTQLSSVTLTIGTVDYTANFVGTTSTSIAVPDDTVTRALLKETVLPTGVAISPVKGNTITFTGKKTTFVVTAQDRKTRETYTVSLQNEEVSLNSITLNISTEIKIEGTNIFVGVTDKTTVNSATISTIDYSTGATPNPAQGGTLTFANNGGNKSATITITKGATSQDYTVILQNTTNTITKFEFPADLNNGIRVTVGSTITGTRIGVINVPSIEKLVSNIEHNGMSISPQPNLPLAFNNSEQYTVTSEYGTTRTYTVIVQKLDPVYTFELNGGAYTGANPVIIKIGTVPTFVNPTRNNYKFLGWFTDAGFTKPYYQYRKSYFSLTLYAKWLERHTISFYVNSDGTGNPIPQLVDKGAMAKRISNPSKVGNYFDGWYENMNPSDTDTRFDFSSQITGNKNLYAKWSPSGFSVTFDSDGGSVVNAQMVGVNAYATRPEPDPTRNKDYFMGWFVENPQTMPNKYTPFNFEATPITETTTVYAKFEPVFIVGRNTIQMNVDNIIRKYGDNANLNFLKTRQVASMKDLFKNHPNFNGDITQWDVSRVMFMDGMFEGATEFNQDISLWDVSNVVKMKNMFKDAKKFNQDISSWDVSKVEEFGVMFEGAIAFNHNLNTWDVSSGQFFNGMFAKTNYNHPLDNWDMSSAKSLKGMFTENNAFNQPIEVWDVSKVTNFSAMFYYSVFNQPLAGWDMSSAIHVFNMFSFSKFNHPIGNWDVSSVISIKNLFTNSPYNHPLNRWDVSKVTNMETTFHLTNFNQPIGNWNVANVELMNSMFNGAKAFNQPIGNWNVGKVTGMKDMFDSALSFNQDLSLWDVAKVTEHRAIFREMFITEANKPRFGFSYVELPIDFESDTINTRSFDDAVVTEKIDNPQKNGINTSNKVIKLTKSTGAKTDANTEILISEVQEKDFRTKNVLKIKVYSPKSPITVRVMFIVEKDSNQNLTQEATTTTANAWEELTFDFSMFAIEDHTTFKVLRIYLDYGNVGDDSVYYFDDITF